MTTLFAREYDPSDFIQIDLPAQAKYGRDGQPVAEWAIYHKTHGPAVTIIDPDGLIVFCAGIHHRWLGCGEIWAVFSCFAKNYLAVSMWARELIRHAQNQFGYIRLQATISTDWIEAVFFAERLGFVRECVMTSFGPHGENYYLYALVKNGCSGTSQPADSDRIT